MRGPNERYRPIRSMALRYAGKMPDAAEWWIVRALIPDAWMTKRGPGVLSEAKRVWKKFSPKQRKVSVECGWFPEGGPR